MDRPDDVAAVVLAAGESRRYGSPKQLALLEGRTLLEHVLELAAGAGLRPVVAVVPVWLTRPRSLDDSEALRWVRNPDPARGISHSLRLGFAALPAEVAAAIVLLGDQPTVPTSHLRGLVAARGERPLVASVHAGALMPPLLVERSHFDLVLEPRGDIGLREILAGHPDWVTAIPAPGAPVDVDVPADLDRLSEQ